MGKVGSKNGRFTGGSPFIDYLFFLQQMGDRWTREQCLTFQANYCKLDDDNNASNNNGADTNWEFNEAPNSIVLGVRQPLNI